MVENCGVIAAAKRAPGRGQVPHLHGIEGIGAVNPQRRQQHALDPIEQIRQRVD
jgi:hypothetical protein